MKGIAEAKEGLKALMNSENADKIAGIVAHLDEAEKENTNLQEQHQTLKNKYVDLVAGMTFPEKPKEGVEPQQKDMDTIIQENLEKVVNNRKK